MTEKSRRGLRFLNIQQVAEELNVGVPLVRAMLRSGELRGIQIGGRGIWRVGVPDLEAYIEEAYRSAEEKTANSDVVEPDCAAE